MVRLPRIVVPRQPLHVVQRGKNRQAVFFADGDYRRYLDDLQEVKASCGCALHAYVKTDAVRRAAYLALFRTHLDESAVKMLRPETELGGVAGSARFKQQIEAALQRRVGRFAHGGVARAEHFPGRQMLGQ